MLKLLQRKEIDILKWDDLIAHSPAETIYPYSWYLDSVAENWSALVVDDYRFVMPVVWKKKAGMKYITITSRHHDGFSMFDTKASDYNIVQKTNYNKDVLKALSEACKKEGIKLFFYYSLLDWRHDDYFPRGRTGTGIKGRAETGDWDKYISFMKTQLTELLTNYGDIAGMG